MQAIAVSDSGTYWTRSVADGIRRFYAYERVDELPLYAVAGVAQTNLLREWLRLVGLMAGVSGLLGLTMYQLSRSAEIAQSRAIDREHRIAAERTAEARDVILRELNHRIKNSLNMINGLILLQEGRPGGPNLREISSRVIAIASIHDLLYQSADNLNIDLAALVHRDLREQGHRSTGEQRRSPMRDVNALGRRRCGNTARSVPGRACHQRSEARIRGRGRADRCQPRISGGGRSPPGPPAGRGQWPRLAARSHPQLGSADRRRPRPPVDGTLEIDGHNGSRFDIMFNPAGGTG